MLVTRARLFLLKYHFPFVSTQTKSILIGLAVMLIAVYVRVSSGSKKINPQFFDINYIVQIYPADGHSDKDASLKQIREILKRRAEAAGFTSSIETIDEDKIRLKFQKVDDTLLATRIVTANNKLEFRELYTSDQIPAFFTVGEELAKKYFPTVIKQKQESDSSISPEVRKLLHDMDEEEGKERSGLASLLDCEIRSHPASLGTTYVKDTIKLNQLLSSPEMLRALPNDIKFYYGRFDFTYRTALLLYAVRSDNHNIIVQNSDIDRASPDFDKYGTVEIHINFNQTGARKFEMMTEKNIGKSIAIVIDGSVISAPRINNPIRGRYVNVTGYFTTEEAINIAAQLNGGVIPAEIKIINQKISPEHSDKWKITLIISMFVFVGVTALAQLIFKILKAT